MRGLRTKLGILRSTLHNFDYDIIVLSETWLNHDISSAELSFHKNYTIFRLDRSSLNSVKKDGGGILVAVHSRILAHSIPNNSPEIEHLFIKLKINTLNLILCCAYIAPNSPTEIYSSHFQEIELIHTSSTNSELLIVGDYNLPNIKWDTDFPSHSANSTINIVRESMCDLNLTQFNYVCNSFNNLLDLVFSTLTDVVVTEMVDSILPLDIHFHPALEITLSLPSAISLIEPRYTLRNYKKGKFTEINSYIADIDWDNELRDLELEIAIYYFYNVLNNAIDLFVPISRMKNDTFPSWYSPILKKSIIDKKILHRKYKQTGSLIAYNKFKELRAKCNALSRSDYLRYISEIEIAIPSNINNFWNFINNMKKDNSIPSSMFLNNCRAESPPSVCNLFAQNFSSVYNSSDCVSDFAPTWSDSKAYVSTLSISSDELLRKLIGLRPNNNVGPDGIPPMFLKNCSYVILKPLLYIFNSSLQTGTFPSKWKTSFITPIYKSGDKSNVTNFRPICTQSAIPKLFDSIITDKLTPLISNIISPYQHGFLKGRSTSTNLLIYENFLNKALENHLQVDSIYTDLSKAFDTVNHHLLLLKLEHIGIQGPLLLWISSYIQGRSCRVRIKGHLSNEFSVTSGVPQGSHLGPLLFLLFFNDASHIFSNVEILLFADDLKIFRTVRSLDDCLILQENFEVFDMWCRNNGLSLNLMKCKIISFYRTTRLIPFSYSCAGAEIIRVDKVHDLGILLDSRLTYVPHVEARVSKARKMLGFISRSTKPFKNIKVLKILYASLVRSQLEYSTIIWNPFYANHISAIERVQHKFLRIINHKLGIGISDLDYDAIMSLLNLQSLEDRRNFFDIAFLSKLVNGKIDCPVLLGMINFRLPTHRTRSNNLFEIPFHNTNYGYANAIDRIQRSANRTSHRFDIFHDSLETLKSICFERSNSL